MPRPTRANSDPNVLLARSVSPFLALRASAHDSWLDQAHLGETLWRQLGASWVPPLVTSHQVITLLGALRGAGCSESLHPAGPCLERPPHKPSAGYGSLVLALIPRAHTSTVVAARIRIEVTLPWARSRSLSNVRLSHLWPPPTDDPELKSDIAEHTEDPHSNGGGSSLPTELKSGNVEP